MIGDKFLNIPRTIGDAEKICKQLGLKCHILDEHLFENAVHLVEINNELYNKLKNPTWLKERINSL